MTLTVGTNSYVSVGNTDTFFATRLQNTAWTSADDVTKEAALITATSMIDEEYQFIGVTVSDPQPLAWPRDGAQYTDPKTGRLTDANDAVAPPRVVLAVQTLAEHLLRNPTLLSEGEQTFEKIKIGPIELQDSLSDFKDIPRFPPTLRKILGPLLVSGGTDRTVWRAN